MTPKQCIKKVTLKDDIYHRHLMILVGGDSKWLKDFALDTLKEDLVMPDTTDGCHFDHVQNGYIYYFIWLQEFDGSPQAVSTLSHEINHFALSSLSDLQVEISGKSDEAFCYFSQSYLQRALKKLQYGKK